MSALVTFHLMYLQIVFSSVSVGRVCTIGERAAHSVVRTFSGFVLCLFAILVISRSSFLFCVCMCVGAVFSFCLYQLLVMSYLLLVNLS